MLQQINSLTATVGAPLAQSSRADTIGLTNNPTIPVVESSSGISAANVSCVRHNPMHGDASHAMHLSPPGISASTLTSVSAPPEIASLTSQDFPYPSSRIKGNFYSAPEDTLMAHRLFPTAGSPPGVLGPHYRHLDRPSRCSWRVGPLVYGETTQYFVNDCI
ncbi:hypothetical protein PF007_g23220 [Phytophthora fragariae]|uniref:Uncharacterized protein n=1 Tax=Phytophthora fragariae TaxID=53985 RepID=A0A6A3QNI3_9STRA|nr:hypothetical protein PF007_g23220 [Phytophthora fragariae]